MHHVLAEQHDLKSREVPKSFVVYCGHAVGDEYLANGVVRIYGFAYYGYGFSVETLGETKDCVGK